MPALRNHVKARKRPMGKKKGEASEELKAKKQKKTGLSYFGGFMKNIYAREDLLTAFEMGNQKHSSKSSADGSPVNQFSAVDSQVNQVSAAVSHVNQVSAAASPLNQDSALARLVNQVSVSDNQGDHVVPPDPSVDHLPPDTTLVYHIPVVASPGGREKTHQTEKVNSQPPSDSTTRDRRGKRPPKKCKVKDCESCTVEVNCEVCEFCLNPGLKLKCKSR